LALLLSARARDGSVRGVTLLPVVDLDFPVPIYLIWRRDNQSALLQRFEAQVKAVVLALGRDTQKKRNGKGRA
jgi:hypothetical protein